MFVAASFKFNAVWVGVEIGLLRSLVFSTLFSSKFIFVSATVDAPVPPFSIDTMPNTFCVFIAEKAKGT